MNSTVCNYGHLSKKKLKIFKDTINLHIHCNIIMLRIRLVSINDDVIVLINLLSFHETLIVENNLQYCARFN